MIGEATEVQKNAMEDDERQGMVEIYLNTMLPANWSRMDLWARRSYLNGEMLVRPVGTVQRDTVSNAEIWCERFGKQLSDMKPADSYAIMAMMEKVEGWTRTKTRKRMPIYGQQRVYVRDGA